MKITVDHVEYPDTNNKGNKKRKKDKQKNVKAAKTPKAPRNKSMSKKQTKQKKSSASKDKRAVVGVPTNKREKLVDMGIMRSHNFLSMTTPMLTKIFGMTRVGNTNKYEMDSEPHHVSAIMKLILTTMETNELSEDWSIILWNITQQDEILPEGCSVTFTRAFERRDDDQVRKRVKSRRRLAILSSDSGENIKRQSVAVSHDSDLLSAIDSGDSVISFGAEAIVTAPDEVTLEIAVDAVKNYLSANDETRGLKYELDLNKQNRPFISYGPNSSSGNKDVYTDLTSEDAATSAMFVDSGGDRTPGSEYMGVSVGKLIRSHAAYNFQNPTSLYVGNDTTGITSTLGGDIQEPSQIYLSKVASRAYLLTGKTVTHIVADAPEHAQQLMTMPISSHRKQIADVSKGLLNLLEPIDDGTMVTDPERMLSLFPEHMNNIITLLSQFRDQSDMKTLNVTDKFASVARSILVDFYVYNKYWSYNARQNIDDLRFIGVKHDQYKKLSDFGQYVAQRKNSNKESKFTEALDELDDIVNNNILPTIPALDTHTNSIVDELVKAQYRVVDLTGMSGGSGSSSSVSNPSMNLMMIAYMNLLLPSLNNGDVLVLHGISRLSSIAGVIRDMIASSGVNLDVIYTEKNQKAARTMIEATSETIVGSTTGETRAMHIDFTVLDLYNNRSDDLIVPFGMDREWVATLSQNPSSFFIKTERGLDYIYLDKIL